MNISCDTQSIRSTLTMAICLTLSTELMAVNESDAFSGAAELGTIFTSGNTETESINGKFKGNYEGDQWDTELRMDALTTEESGITSNERYSAQLQFDRKFSEASYLALVGQRQKDRFSGFDYQSLISLGYGHRIIKSDSMKLDVEVGPGYRRDKIEITDEVVEEGILRLAGNYEWQIKEGVKLEQLTSADLGEDSDIYRSETSLQTQINGSIATKLTYKVKHVSEVPVDTEKTDSEFGVTLVYSF